MRNKETVIKLIQQQADALRAENNLSPTGRVHPLTVHKLPEKWVDLERGQLIDDSFRMDLHRQFSKHGAGFQKNGWLEAVNEELRQQTRNEIPTKRPLIADVKVIEERIGDETVLHGYVKLNNDILLNAFKTERFACHR